MSLEQKNDKQRWRKLAMFHFVRSRLGWMVLSQPSGCAGVEDDGMAIGSGDTDGQAPHSRVRRVPL